MLLLYNCLPLEYDAEPELTAKERAALPAVERQHLEKGEAAQARKWARSRKVLGFANVTSMLLTLVLSVAIVVVAITVSNPATAYKRNGPGHLGVKNTFTNL